MLSKYCPQCETEKPANAFYRDKHQKDGLTTQCKACRIAYSRTYHADHAEAIRARHHAYYVTKRRQALERMRAYSRRKREEREAKDEYS